MRSFLALVPLLPALLLAADVPLADADPHAAIHARAIPLDEDAPWRRRVGALRYVAGWQLWGDHVRFGGISSMTIAAGRLTALSDEGWVIAFTLGRHGPVDPSIRRLPVLGYAAQKMDRDTESMARDPATGAMWVGVEHRNAIWRFSRDFAHVEAAIRPAAMREWPENGGAEAVVRLADGRFLVIAEAQPELSDTREALLFARDPVTGVVPTRLRYRPGTNCDPTDAALLPEGRVLVLERCVSWLDGVSAIVRIVDPRRVRRGGLLAGPEIARLARPDAVDNMEALAITREAGRTMVWIASDDNFELLQRTLLLKFELHD